MFLAAGRTFDAAASGRDKGRGYKYFLACAFTIPFLRGKELDSDGKPDSSDPFGPKLDLPEMAELFPDIDEGAFRARKKRPEEPDIFSGAPRTGTSSPPPADARPLPSLSRTFCPAGALLATKLAHCPYPLVFL